MICIKEVKKYCKDYTNIENYELAIKDNETWDCHHRDEIKTLPSGIKVIRTIEELKEMGRYYDCPANELIFLTRKDHNKLHKTGNLYSLGRTLSKETKSKISNSHKGKVMSEFGRKFKEHYGLSKHEDPKLYHYENTYYQRHHKCSWE